MMALARDSHEQTQFLMHNQVGPLLIKDTYVLLNNFQKWSKASYIAALCSYACEA